MKFKSLLYFGMAALGFAATSCSEDDAKYAQTDPCEMPEAYFAIASPTSYELQETDTKIVVPVYRAEAGEALTVAVTATMSDPGLFTAPASVTFAADETETDYEITFVPTDLQGAVDYNFKLEVGDGSNNPYAVQTKEFVAVYFPWEDLVGENGELMGTWVEDLTTTYFGYTPNPNPTWGIKIQKSPAIEGLYRVVNPYENFNIDGAGKLYDTPVYIYFNCKDPNAVFISNNKGDALVDGKAFWTYTGFDLGYGNIRIMGDYNYCLMDKDPEGAAMSAGTLKDGVIKFPKNAILINMPNYNNKISYSNANGLFRVIFPGCKDVEDAPEPEEWESIGQGEFTDPCIAPLYGAADGTSWAVEIQKHNETDGLYRMVNPYKSGVMIVDGEDWGYPYDGDLYIEFEVGEANCAVVEMQPTGYVDEADTDPFGRIYIINMAANFIAGGETVEDIVASGYNDVYDASTRTLTFNRVNGTSNLRMYFPDLAKDHQFYNKIPGLGASGKIVLPAEEQGQSAMKIANYTGAFNKVLRSNGIRVKASKKAHKSVRRYDAKLRKADVANVKF